MTRLDDLLRVERERQQGLEVRPPRFDAVRSRGVRRRQRRRVVGVAGAAVVAAVVVLGGQAVMGRGVGPLPGPAVSPAPAPTQPVPTPPVPVPPQGPDRAAPSPDPVLLDLAVSPDDEDVRAGLWQRCPRRCAGGRWELRLTRDGYATAGAAVPVAGRWAPMVTALGGDAFHLSAETGASVVRADGSTSPVRVQPAAGPLAAGEVLVRRADGRPLALDPDRAVAHPLSAPEGLAEVLAHADGTLVGWTWSEEGARAVWSRDRGATWQERPLATDASALLQVLPSAQPGTLALVEGGDGATLFPLGRVHRSTDGGETWETVDLPDDERAFLGAAGVDADGRLVVDVVEWSGDGGQRGIHVSDGADWSTLTLSHLHPEEAHRDLRMVATEDDLQIRSITDGVGVVDVSTDGGETWDRLAAQ